MLTLRSCGTDAPAMEAIGLRYALPWLAQRGSPPVSKKAVIRGYSWRHARCSCTLHDTNARLGARWNGARRVRRIDRHRDPGDVVLRWVVEWIERREQLQQQLQ